MLRRTASRVPQPQPCLSLPRIQLQQIRHSTDDAASSQSQALHQPTNAPKIALDIKHIRQNPQLHAENARHRNYPHLISAPETIIKLHLRWRGLSDVARERRKEANELQKSLSTSSSGGGADGIKNELRKLRDRVKEVEAEAESVEAEIEGLAVQMPNLMIKETPLGDEPTLVEYINPQLAPSPDQKSTETVSHVDIGAELGLLDFAAASTTSGWGWYYLLNEAALLEQALVQYALSVARKRGWQIVTPPSIVYSHIGTACGFRPRDQHGEQQVYAIEQSEKDSRKPQHSLSGTAEIALAAWKANSTLKEADLPLKVVGVSRSYRAEAGARGVDTKGLYRVHEFTKVELFAWTLPGSVQSKEVFDEMLGLQTEILQSLDLHARVLEMPAADLGASAMRKRDIEAYFPSRRDTKHQGWGELTSTSECGDYQSRRLATRVKRKDGKLEFPFTLNGTALAVPRVVMAILENGWDAETRRVKVPEVLRQWMGIDFIEKS
jgi:seryl-tRNA synthetase